MLLKIFWVVARRQFLVYDQRFGTTCLSNLQGLRYNFLPKTLKMGQTSDPETLVINQKLTPGNNPKILSKTNFASNSKLEGSGRAGRFIPKDILIG
jgi:hypothetical protein